MTYEEFLKLRPSDIKSIPDQEKNEFLQTIIEEWVKIIIKKYEDSSLWGKELPWPTYEICQEMIKKRRNLPLFTPKAKDIFFIVSIKFEGQEVVRRILNEENNGTLKTILRWFKEKTRLKKPVTKTQIIEKTMKTAYGLFKYKSFYCTKKTALYDQEIKDIKNSDKLSLDEKDCLEKYFSQYQTDSEKIEDVNDLMNEIFTEKSPYTLLPSYQEAEEFLEEINNSSSRSTRELKKKEFREKYIKKQLLRAHFYLMEKAIPEIQKLYDFIQVNIRDIWVIQTSLTPPEFRYEMH